MGGNNKQQQVATSGASGGDPRGRIQNQSQYQQDRYENQQGPLAAAMANNYGRFSEADYGNYTDMMNQYRDIASGGGSSGGGGGGGGANVNYSAFTVNPERVSAERANTERASVRSLGPLERVGFKDPYKSYGGFEEFSQTGGYSPQDIQNMRARGMAPIRAAYGNAERAVGQQRSLQGGYAPNAIAAQIKMAREQGQGMADASQNVDAQIAQARNQGRLAGYGGMSNIEGQRGGFQMQGDIFNAGQANEGQKFDISNEMNTSQFNAGQGNQVGMFNAGQGNQVGMFNANLGFEGQKYNADAYTQAEARNNAAAQQAAASRSAAAGADQQARLQALGGMRSLYGTTPGASQMFGDQAAGIVNAGGNFGLGLLGRDIQSQGLPGAYDQTRDRIGDIMNTAYPIVDRLTGYGQGGQQQPTYQPTYQNRQAYTNQQPIYNDPYNQQQQDEEGMANDEYYIPSGRY